MRLFEHEAKELLRGAGVPVAEGVLVQNTGQAETVPDAVLPGVVKAQVLSGGRMKAGGVLFTADRAELRSAVGRLLGSELKGHLVERVLVDAQAQVAKEYYLGITYDETAKGPVALFTRGGGVDVEEGDEVARVQIPLLLPQSPFRFKELLAGAGVSGRLLGRLSGIFTRLAILFRDRDCTLVEINPLAITSGGDPIALDAHIELDEDALFRHQDLVERWSLAGRTGEVGPRSTLEQRAEEIDSADHRGVAGRMVEFPGSLGLLIGGGGASLTAFDAVRRHGGEPANYCEIGGNPSVWKVKELTKLLLGRDGVDKVAVIMNVVSNTRVDLVARGVVKGILELGLDPGKVITIFRIPGAWEQDGFAILRKYGVPYADRTVSIDEAARRAVKGKGAV